MPLTAPGANLTPCAPLSPGRRKSRNKTPAQKTVPQQWAVPYHFELSTFRDNLLFKDDLACKHLGIKTLNALSKAGIQTVRRLLAATPQYLKGIEGVGPQAIFQIRDWQKTVTAKARAARNVLDFDPEHCDEEHY